MMHRVYIHPADPDRPHRHPFGWSVIEPYPCPADDPQACQLCPRIAEACERITYHRQRGYLLDGADAVWAGLRGDLIARVKTTLIGTYRIAGIDGTRWGIVPVDPAYLTSKGDGTIHLVSYTTE